MYALYGLGICYLFAYAHFDREMRWHQEVRSISKLPIWSHTTFTAVMAGINNAKLHRIGHLWGEVTSRV